MPIYEYRCPKCHRAVEIFQMSTSEQCAPLCCDPDCNTEMVKEISLSNFSLKGGGWFKDGYTKKK